MLGDEIVGGGRVDVGDGDVAAAEVELTSSAEAVQALDDLCVSGAGGAYGGRSSFH